MTVGEPFLKTPHSGIADETLAALQSRFRGQLLRPSDAGYGDARQLWNAMIDKHPALIAQCLDTSDVAAAVEFAREQALPLSVKGGGHGVAGKAVCDGGLMIDLSLMNDVVVDPDARTARVGGGATWGGFDAATQAHGLATTGGIIPMTGVGGLTLGGGLGVLMRRFGLACDNLLAAEVVLADGAVVTTSETEHPDLFWALRGGGGNFGVVTAFTFQVHPVGPMILGGFVVHPFADARAVCRFHREITATVPNELATYLGFATFPDGQLVVAFVFGYTGALAEGERVLAPLRNFGQPALDTVGPLPYTELQALFAPSYPPGLHNYWKGNFLTELTDEAIEILIEQFAKTPSAYTSMGIEHLGGAVARVDPVATAFPERDAHYSLLITPAWEDPAETERCIQWGRETWNRIQPHAKESVYVNYVGLGEEDRVRAVYGANYARLANVKAVYDPDNLFRANHNIAPA